MNVIFSPKVEEYLFELMEILYEQGYFGFKESAVQYVKDLIFDIRTKLPTSLKRTAPEYFSKYGEKLLFSMFKKSKTTQWYVFFNLYENKGEFIYLVHYISNNHIIAKYL